MTDAISHEGFTADSIRKALKSIRKKQQRYESLGDHPLVHCKIVQEAISPARRDNVMERGRALQQWLMQAIETMRPSAGQEDPTRPEWHVYILLKHYLAQTESQVVADYLSMSNAAYYRNLKGALSQLGAYLYEQEFHYTAEPEQKIYRPIEPIAALSEHTYRINTLALSQDQTLLVSGGGDLRINFWDFITHRFIGTIYRSRWVGSLTLSADGAWLFAIEGSGILSGWALPIQNWKMPQYQVNAHTGASRTITITPSGRLFSAGVDGLIQEWTTPDFHPVATLQGHDREIRRIDVNSTETLLLSGDVDGNVILWDLSTPSYFPQRVANHGPASIRSVAFHPNGEFFAFTTSDGDVGLVEVKTLKSVYIRAAHESHAIGVVFHPALPWLVTSGRDKLIKIWNLEKWEQWNTSVPAPIQVLTTHQAVVTVVMFSHDGKTLLSASHDTHILLWSVDALLASISNP